MRLPSKKQAFWLLMAASAVAFVLPPRFLAPVHGLFDPVLAPMSAWLHQGSQSVREQTRQWMSSQEAADNSRLQAERDSYLAEIIWLRNANRILTTQRDQALALRAELKLQGRLVPAQLLARDAVSWREAALIDRGRNDLVKPKQWVMAGVRGFIDRGHDASLAENQYVVLPMSSPAGQEQFARSVLIGRVEQVGQVTSRIKLLTDWDSTVSGQVFDPRTNRAGPLCTVRGQGPGQPLLAERVERLRSAAGEPARDEPPAAKGQLVLTSPAEGNMPGQLMIGVIEEVTRVSPVEYSLKVAPAGNYDYASRVFVIDMSPPEPAREGR